MAKRSYTIELGVPAERALEACQRAISELGWDVIEPASGAQLATREDITKLSCGTSPARIDLELHSGGSGTSIVMAGSVPGPQWVGDEHLRSRMLGLGRRILIFSA